MTFEISPKAPSHMVRDSQAVHEAIGGQLFVKANQAWNRVTVRRGESVYFVSRANVRVAVQIEGGNVDKFLAVAIERWGEQKSEYHGPNGEHEIFWRILFKDFVENLLAVMTGQGGMTEDDPVHQQWTLH